MTLEFHVTVFSAVPYCAQWKTLMHGEFSVHASNIGLLPESTLLTVQVAFCPFLLGLPTPREQLRTALAEKGLTGAQLPLPGSASGEAAATATWAERAPGPRQPAAA